MNQGSLLPIGVSSIHQAVPFNSADKPIFVAGTDSQDYAAKLPLPENPCLPISELISYCLSARVGIAVPAYAVLEFEDGRKAFGSRFEGGIAQYSQMTSTERMEAITQCGRQIYQLCVLDAFLANPDRHLDNLLFRRSPFGGRWTVIGMDFSRALWRSGFPSTPVSAIFANGNTATLVRILAAFGGIDARIKATVVGSLQAITTEQIMEFIAQLPSELHCAASDGLPKWWASAERLHRIESLLELTP